jgi:transcriptional regulator GlxA family with amidase domain
MRIGIVLFDQVDVLDVGGPYEVFLTASRLATRAGEDPPFEVVTVGSTTNPVTAYGGLRLIPQVALNEARDLHVLVVPGSIVVDEVIADSRLLAAIRASVSRVDIVASVCTGAFLLGELGLLTGNPWTTHWEDVQELSGRIGGEAHSNVQWVDAQAVVTSGGLSSGMSMALHLVDRFASRALAELTAKQLEYEWDPEAGIDVRSDETSGPRRS